MPALPETPPTSALSVGTRPAPPAVELAPLWRELERRADGSFFLSWPWVGCWLETLAATPLLVEVHRGEQLVGLGLFVQQLDWRRGLLPVRTLTLHATAHPELDGLTIGSNGFLAERGLEADVTRAIIGHLARRQSGWDALVLPNVSESFVRWASARALAARVRSIDGTTVVDLDAIRDMGGSSLDPLDSDTRDRIRRTIRHYAAKGPLRLEAASDAAMGLAFIEEAGRLREARWTSRANAGPFAPGLTTFHRCLLARALPMGAVELLRISAGDEPIGYLCNVLHRETAHLYLCGLRVEEDSRLSPELVAQHLGIEHHLALGTRRYVMTAEAGGSRTSLGQPGPNLVTLALERRRPWLVLAAIARRLQRSLRPARAAARAG